MRFFNQDEQNNSKEVAKKRLKSLLSYERHQISEEMLNIIKSDIIQCVEDYYKVDRNTCEVFISDDEDSAIIAILPISKGIKNI